MKGTPVLKAAEPTMRRSRVGGDGPSLELLTAEPAVPAHATPLLFVHGAFSGAFQWEEHFLPHFARHGWVSHALSLRGHGASKGGAELATASLDDYLADMERVIATLPVAPVLIGHSMGGILAQLHAERDPPPALALIAPVPPGGLAVVSAYMAWRDPMLSMHLGSLIQAGPERGDVQLLRHALFAPDTPMDQVLRFLHRSHGESARVVWDLTWFRGVDTARIDCPVRVMGADDDHFIPAALVRRTAERYGTEARLFAGVGHAMMLDLRWQEVADDLLSWLDEQKLG